MNESRDVRCPFSFYVGLAAAVAAAGISAALYGGGSWALGALLGAGAVGADFYFLTIFAVTWVKAARRGGRGLLALGVAALAGKTFLPPAIILALVRVNAVSAYPAAFGALVVATCAPALLAASFLRESGRKPNRLWKS
jgi:hypothetical protein